MLTQKAFRKVVAAAAEIQVYVKFTLDDGEYITISRAKALAPLAGLDPEILINAFVTDHGTLLIG